MTVISDQNAVAAVTDTSSSVHKVVLGTVLSLFGSVAIYAGSVRYDWSSVPVVIGIFLCGVVGLYCGVSARTSSARNGSPQTGTERFLMGVSLVAGFACVSIALMVLMVLGLFVVLSSR